MNLILIAAVCLAAAPIASAGDTSRPMIEFSFSNSLENSGRLGGAGRMVEYAPCEGPRFGPGVHGMGLDLTASSRGGGSSRTPAGGAVAFSDERIDHLDRMTVALWFRPDSVNVTARLLYYAPSWDLFVSGRAIGFKTRHDKKDVPHITPSDHTAAELDAWNFVAVTLDNTAGQCCCYHGIRRGELQLLCTWNDVPKLDRGPADLNVGNLAGIRPFKGLIDSVRVYDRILDQTELETLFRAGNGLTCDLHDVAEHLPRRPAILNYGDVCLSSRSIHPDSIKTLQLFRANRLMWAYPNEADFIRQCKDAGVESYQAAINSLPGHDNRAAQCLDLDGQPVVAPWMVAFNRAKPVYWGCNNRPGFMDTCVQRAKIALDHGADWIQFDDWALITSAHQWGGACFCNDCMTKFRQYITDNLSAQEQGNLGIKDIATFDYRQYLAERYDIRDAATYKTRRREVPLTIYFEDFQRRSVRVFFAELRKRLNAEAGRIVPMSVNSSFQHPAQQSNFIADEVDFLQGETWQFDLERLAIASRVAEGLGKWQVFVPKPRNVGLARQAIAASYAMGQLMLVPWDMYMGSDATGIQPRYYGTVEDYGNLFHFVRDHESLFNGYENAATTGVVVDLDHFDSNRVAALVRRLFDAQTPFTLLPVGQTYYDCHLDVEQLKRFQLVLIAADELTMTRLDRTALMQAAADTIVIPDRAATHTVLSDAAVLRLWGPKGIYLLPRVKPGAGNRTLICHVLNRLPEGSPKELPWILFLVKQSAFLGERLVAARWHAPGQASIKLDFQALPSGVRIVIPRLADWGLVELQFAD